MRRGGRQFTRPGFTLIEVLVTLVILALLVATVFPVVSKQIEDAEPTRLANDLANIRTGIETFALNVRPTFPGDLEDLVNGVTAASSSVDAQIDGSQYETKHANRWKGPYVDATVTTTSTPDAAVVTTGFAGSLINDLELYASALGNAGRAAANPDFVAVMVTGLTSTEWGQVNNLVDGENEASSSTEGKIRLSAAQDTLYYLAVPYSN